LVFPLLYFEDPIKRVELHFTGEGQKWATGSGLTFIYEVRFIFGGIVSRYPLRS
jgi:hypothetical protein